MNICRLIILTLILSLPSHFYAYAQQPLKLEAKESSYQFPFFDTQTPVWAYNGQIPGPVIRGKEGSTLVVNFLNNLKEPSSIHWHGLRIDNAMDGVPVNKAKVPIAQLAQRFFTQTRYCLPHHAHLATANMIESSE